MCCESCNRSLAFATEPVDKDIENVVGASEVFRKSFPAKQLPEQFEDGCVLMASQWD